MRHHATLRIYNGAMRCHIANCDKPHGRNDVNVVRVWPKSVCIQLQMHPHPRRRIRMKSNGHYLQGDDINISISQIMAMSRWLDVFDSAVFEVLPVPKDLSFVVIQFSGVMLFTTDNFNRQVEHDTELMTKTSLMCGCALGYVL